MYPDQTAPAGAVSSGYTLFIYEASNTYCLVDDKNIHFVIMRFKVYALRYKCEVSQHTVRIFMNCMHVCAAQKAY